MKAPDDIPSPAARDVPNCLEWGPKGYVCTRPQGHDGDHVAHGAEAPGEVDYVCERWAR